MAGNKIHKSALSSFLMQPPSHEPRNISKLSQEEIEEELEAAMAAEDGARALEILDAAPRWMQKDPYFMMTRATALISLGETNDVPRIFREIERKDPRYKGHYFPMAIFYMEQGWFAHGLQAAKRVPSSQLALEEVRTMLDEMIAEATHSIQTLASETGLPFETMQRAISFHEQALMSLDEDKLSEVDHFCREAIKIAPDWNPPHNNRSQALFYTGRVAEAIAISQEVLTREPDSVFALHNLVIYHTGMNQPEKAREYAKLLGEQINKFSKDSPEIDQILSAFALVEDTPALWKIAQRYLNASSDNLLADSWQILAVAAIRTNKWKEALKLITKANDEELTPMGKQFKDELKGQASNSHPRLAWMPPAYSGVNLFFNLKIINEWETLLQKVSDSLSPSQQRKINSFIEKYPFMLVTLKMLLWHEETHIFAVQLLSQLDNPDADAEIERFAFSQTGSLQTRMNALFKLNETGRYQPPKVVKLWHENLEEWRETSLYKQLITDIEPNARPVTLALIVQASETEDPQEAITLLRQAVKEEPTSPIALFNLGVTLTQNGKKEEGQELINRSIEVDPTYIFGHASIALTEAMKSHDKEALDHLQVVTQAEIIQPETAVVANLAWAVLAISKGDLETADRHLDLVAELSPDHPWLAEIKKRRTEEESFLKEFGSLLEYQRLSARRSHVKLLETPLETKMELRACLQFNTKDMLVGIAHFWETSPSGKKDEVISHLTEAILNPAYLKETLDDILEKRERKSMAWILQADGVRPWGEFTHKFGDDMDESVYWDYHDPNTIPGRLRMSGLFFTGTLEGKLVAFIPTDVRPLLRELLKSELNR